ncbi:hypothetical protein [Synechococcus sp. CBW1004]|uniref:hypothetical protein n=1 Tax=Synechococcus sp. CBW1004 TaxID=1353136 RepID=UPI0018CD51CC|nr:hypothetical protein [Synechococcus sp. CBW1004]QPN62408.1 hypothetical protein H8F25_11865 [Synechococcus sp. CBW1004]
MSGPWHGPSPSAGQRLLLAGCLEPDPERAVTAWRRWREMCDFDHEDAASHELASLLVARIGMEEAGGGIAIRSLGWYRRAWVLSELAASAAGALAQACREQDLQVTAIGDLAGWLSGTSHAGRRLPIRSIELVIANAGRRRCDELRALALHGPAGAAIKARQIGLRILPMSGDRLAAATAATATSQDDLALPTAGAMIAHLAARNWCWDPPQRLRWMAEILSIVQAGSDPQNLAAAMGAVIARADLGWSAKQALQSLQDVMPTDSSRQCLDPLISAARAVPDGLAAGTRGRLRQTRLGPWLTRGQLMLLRLQPDEES